MNPAANFSNMSRHLAADPAFLTTLGRRKWLEDAGISYLNPQLYFDTDPDAFVA